MAERLTRRLFLALTGAFVIAPHDWAEADMSQTAGAEAVPLDLDHILLGTNDLDQGIAWVEQRCGIRAAYGGVHPGRGTRNALLALGDNGQRRYLEIIAPDPEQPKPREAKLVQSGQKKSAQQPSLAEELGKLKKPHLIGWAVHTDDIDLAAKNAAAAGMAFFGPREGSRARPDGKVLRWKTLTLQKDYDGLLPFFIQWDAQSVHPSQDAPQGCRLESFVLRSPIQSLPDVCKKLGVTAAIESAKASGLHARISSPRGEFELG